jgi:DKNYY family
VYYTFDETSEPIKVDGADVSSFQEFCLPDDALMDSPHARYALDETQVYIGGQPINRINSNILNATEADPAHFQFVSGNNSIHYFKDLRNVFYCTNAGFLSECAFIPDADAASFTSDPTILPYAKDKMHIYQNKEVINGVDIDTFKSFEKSPYYAADKSHAYYIDIHSIVTVINGENLSTFHAFQSPKSPNGGRAEDVYAQGNSGVYCAGILMTNVATSSFLVLPNFRAFDGQYYYDMCRVESN